MHANSPSPRKHPVHSRQYQAPLPHRDFSHTLATEAKPTRRSHRTKPNQAESQQTQPAAVYRVEGTKECLMNPDELSSVFAHVKHSHPNKKIVVYKTSTTPQTHEFHQLVDEMCIKHGVELKHSQNSPFQQYRSQSLQDLTSSSTTNPLTPRDFDFQFQPIDKQEHTRVTYVKKWLVGMATNSSLVHWQFFIRKLFCKWFARSPETSGRNNHRTARGWVRMEPSVGALSARSENRHRSDRMPDRHLEIQTDECKSNSFCLAVKYQRCFNLG